MHRMLSCYIDGKNSSLTKETLANVTNLSRYKNYLCGHIIIGAMSHNLSAFRGQFKLSEHCDTYCELV